MALEEILARGRAAAEERLVDTWTIGADLGWVFVNGKDVQTVTPLFTTKARLTERGTQVADTEVGGRTAAETHRELHIPWNSPATPPNAVAQCTAIAPSTDPMVLGTIVRLRGSAPMTQKTARRLEVVEVLT